MDSWSLKNRFVKISIIIKYAKYFILILGRWVPFSFFYLFLFYAEKENNKSLVLKRTTYHLFEAENAQIFIIFYVAYK